MLAKRVLGERFAQPLDGGATWRDGRPLLGPSKTIRGVVLAILCTEVVGLAFGLPLFQGAVIGAASMAGDVLSSFVKRRLGLDSSSRALGLDQVPEALLPALAAKGVLGLDWIGVLLVVALFFLIELAASRVLFRLGIREQPY